MMKKRNFAMKTCLLDTLSAGICDAITGGKTTDSGCWRRFTKQMALWWLWMGQGGSSGIITCLKVFYKSAFGKHPRMKSPAA
jgi:hypothetical protein